MRCYIDVSHAPRGDRQSARMYKEGALGYHSRNKPIEKDNTILTLPSCMRLKHACTLSQGGIPYTLQTSHTQPSKNISAKQRPHYRVYQTNSSSHLPRTEPADILRRIATTSKYIPYLRSTCISMFPKCLIYLVNGKPTQPSPTREPSIKTIRCCPACGHHNRRNEILPQVVCGK